MPVLPQPYSAIVFDSAVVLQESEGDFMTASSPSGLFTPRSAWGKSKGIYLISTPRFLADRIAKIGLTTVSFWRRIQQFQQSLGWFQSVVILGLVSIDDRNKISEEERRVLDHFESSSDRIPFPLTENLAEYFVLSDRTLSYLRKRFDSFERRKGWSVWDGALKTRKLDVLVSNINRPVYDWLERPNRRGVVVQWADEATESRFTQAQFKKAVPFPMDEIKGELKRKLNELPEERRQMLVDEVSLLELHKAPGRQKKTHVKAVLAALEEVLE